MSGKQCLSHSIDTFTLKTYLFISTTFALDHAPDTDNDNDATGSESEDGGRDRGSEKDSVQDSECESIRSREGPATKEDGNCDVWDDPWELYESTCKSPTYLAMHVSPLIVSAAHPPSPSPSPFLVSLPSLPPSSTTAPCTAPDLTAAMPTTTPGPAGTSETQAKEASATVQAATPSSVTNSEALSSSFVTIPQQTPQANPNPSVISMRQQQIWKALDLQLNACTCGVNITDIEIQEGKNVMQCHVPGCETIWVSAYFAPLLAPTVSNQGTLLSFIKNAWAMNLHHESGLVRAVRQAPHTIVVYRGSIEVLLLNMVA